MAVRHEYRNRTNRYGMAYGQNDSAKLFVEVWKLDSSIAPDDPANDSPGQGLLENHVPIQPHIFKQTIYNLQIKYNFVLTVERDEPMRRL